MEFAVGVILYFWIGSKIEVFGLNNGHCGLIIGLSELKTAPTGLIFALSLPPIKIYANFCYLA
ncbi:hypothetical protein [Bacillus sp. THAF10]|uniref:hypothetical protein n=1 Tax=Bacillus sp. THAF10 TaxID=2587848 RepID=UPI0012697B89|nr:hypothetical protein [Bacillus sp. THAF10]